jgi:GNAT superfamily N-acetyltransferase
MSSYRFCRTDDIGLLVDALNRCWAPCFPDEPPMTPAAFKRSIRDLQVWCSSCMVAFSGGDPIGVLIGAKRPSGTLIHKIAVHPDHRRQGHGRHLVGSLGSKLAILGPPRIVGEVPEALAPARELLSASGYVQEAVLTDYVLQREENDGWKPANERQRVSHASGAENGDPATLRHAQDRPERSRGASERAGGAGGTKSPDLRARFVIPVTVDDLAANGLLGEADPQVCWERSVETLTARKDEIAGLAVASDERLEAYILYINGGASPAKEILSLRSLIDDGGAGLARLVSRLAMGTYRFPKVHPAEISKERLEALGFRPAGGLLLLYAASLRQRSGSP